MSLEEERLIRAFLVTILLSLSLGALVGAGLARTILAPTEMESR